MLASDSSRREIASSMIALSSAANAALDAVRGWAWTGCRFFLARKMELGDGGVRLWAMCHLQIAALRSFVDIPSSPGMVSRASRIHVPQESGPSRAPRAHQEKHAESWGCSWFVGWPAYPHAIVIRLFSLDRQAPSLIETVFFPRSHAAYGPLDVLRPKAEGDGFFGGTPADVGPGREKRPEPLDHHRDNSGGKRVRCSTVELSPNPMEGEVR
jgi:hypothetical protein